jgi:multidrug resistance efflux pump
MAEEPPRPEQAESNPPAPADPVRRWTLATLAVIAVLICWYVIADRLTPFTSQARVQAYVIPIAPQVSGRVVDVRVGNNEQVEDDEELVTIDPSSFQLALASAEAALTAARQQVGAASAGVDSAAAAVAAATARLQKSQQEYDRLQRIYTEDPGAVSERRVQSAEASLEEARSGVEQARANLEQAIENQGESGEANSRILAARADVDSARLNLDRTHVRAPGRGLVTDLAVDRGNYAQTGQPLMTFIAIRDLWIQADLTENNLGHVNAGDEVEFVLDVQPGSVFRGRVRSVGYGVATGNDPLGSLPTIQNDPNWLREAQRFPVIIDFDAPDLERNLGLRVGSQVSVVVYTGDNWLLNLLGALIIRLNSIVSYAY